MFHEAKIGRKIIKSVVQLKGGKRLHKRKQSYLIFSLYRILPKIASDRVRTADLWVGPTPLPINLY